MILVAADAPTHALLDSLNLTRVDAGIDADQQRVEPLLRAEGSGSPSITRTRQASFGRSMPSYRLINTTRPTYPLRRRSTAVSMLSLSAMIAASDAHVSAHALLGTSTTVL